MALAAFGTAILVLATLPDTAEAGFRFRGGPLGVARSAMASMMSITGLRHARRAARRGHARAAAMRAQDLRTPAETVRPALRAQLTAAAALAGWRGGRAEQGWWQHADGSYGWVGPLFWPFADDDLTDAVLLGDNTALWAYGYGDIYAAIFAPYGASELAAYAAAPSRRSKIPSLQQLCETGDSASSPAERIATLVQPNEAQRAALDDVSAAWTSAGETIRASCPSEAATSALDRFALMQSRLDAMIKALDSVEPKLAKFYSLLDEDQKVRLNALAKDQKADRTTDRDASRRDRRRAHARGHRRKDVAREEAIRKYMQAAACQAGSEPKDDMEAQRQYQQLVKQQWPADEIAVALQLDATGRARLDVLQDTAMGTMRDLSPCPPKSALTLPARLAAVKSRLETVRAAVASVNDALDDFEYGLSDEQKARFEAMGQQRGA
jgi:hypothetical protein